MHHSRCLSSFCSLSSSRALHSPRFWIRKVSPYNFKALMLDISKERHRRCVRLPTTMLALPGYCYGLAGGLGTKSAWFLISLGTAERRPGIVVSHGILVVLVGHRHPYQGSESSIAYMQRTLSRNAR